MQRLVFLVVLLGSIVVLVLHAAAGAQRQPILPLPTPCTSNARSTCQQDQPVTNAILICLITERTEDDGCRDAVFIVEIAHHSKARPKYR